MITHRVNPARRSLPKARFKKEKHASDLSNDQRLVDLELQQTRDNLQRHHIDKLTRELEEYRGRFETLYQIGSLGHMTLDDKGNIRELNQTAVNFFETSANSLLETPLLQRVVRDDAH